MTQPKDVRVEVRVRNNLILKRMEQKGIKNVADLCRHMGVPTRQSLVGAIINMKLAARQEDGEWLPIVYTMAAFFECMPEELFSEHQQWDKLEKNRTQAEVSYAEIQQLTARRQGPVTPELALQAAELKRAIAGALSTLTAREERVIRLRFGFDGEVLLLEQIAESFGVTRETIRQIEARALRKLKHPSRARLLALAGGGILRTRTSWGTRSTYTVDEDVQSAL